MNSIGDAVLELAGDQVAPEDQLELLPVTRFAVGTEAHAELVDAVRRKSAGRPPGARNRATREKLEIIVRLFGDPFLESARELLHSPASLAAELNCTKLEAFDRLERIRADLRPYLYARLAAIDGAGRPVAPAFNMMFAALAPGAGSSGPDRPPWLEDFEANGALSHGDVSHGADK